MTECLSADTADEYFNRISEALASPEFRPRALYRRFNIEVLATTDGALDPLAHHDAIPQFRLDRKSDPHLQAGRCDRSGVRGLPREHRSSVGSFRL
jgi:hypothetical protein